ncbi:two-component system chemotaxis response regulator CheB [Rhizobium sp. PP-F2F-G38]|uniref:protein-glutamate methylesterase n=1 Tax=Ferranicluibacter rubi TaxID=2715133 RepID=A0AA43ZF26_9HYPH|nr:chemotaxis protein CheB [Ferranicluibacter rubi]PYE32549.1 two-component system chemotaxis response regulator CheB [Rhizobium sp. PP-WC-1G-195]PYE95978.1 two-component system chemotaxis response regulator CheB [Rhizobium sp. PP-F2F-G38]TCP88417.1 two-component system chemotaxis response regulator CheB [Rhizobium sp. PP-CC-2G-626]TCQ22918.1 two-component system chemotaxis response regulator CheB [Rhizobium sp. PP-CC-3G-465]NHT75773.1 chemotaxis protein CheB [Ferranicluibacter rubi]
MSDLRPQAVVIGASAGALEALTIILPALLADFPVPIMLVVHIPGDKRSVLAELFQAKCRIRVMEVEDKEPLVGGTAYFAPPNYHLLVEGNRTLSLSSDEPVMFSRPSIDVLFESAADAFGAALVGIVLTGANHDGARGLRAISDAGGHAVVQDPATAFAAAMPEGAIARCPDARVLPLDAIAAYLQKVVCA